MGRVAALTGSTVGNKVLVALTGLGLLGFVVFHMLGNLQVFLGPDALNAYARFMKERPALLWAARLGLLAVFALHVILSLRLTSGNRSARPVSYVYNHTEEASLSSRTMWLTGLMILAFVVYHLLHFTVGITNPDYFYLEDAKGRHDVYSMVVLSFQNVYISAAYIVAMLLLGVHLSHGTTSTLQTLGINRHRLEKGYFAIGWVIAGIIVIGNCSMPLAVLAGLVKLPEGR